MLARIIPNGSLEQIIYRVDALHWLEDRGVPVMNSPRAIERCVDKFYTSALLHEAGLATPETIVCERIDDAMAAVREMGDVIIKPLFGSMGHGMVRVSDPETAFRVVRALEMTRAVFYVQRVIDHDGCDVRAFVVGDRVVAAIERRSRDGGWRTNISLGGEARAIELSPSAVRNWRSRAARAVGADYAGVDLLPARDGTVYVLEVNGIPGWSGVQTTTSTDVAGAIVDHLDREGVRVTDRQSPRWTSARAAQLACLLEASAPKPGNVSPGVSFGDTTYEDFLASAAAIGDPLGTAGYATARRDDSACRRSDAPLDQHRTRTSASCCCSLRSRGAAAACARRNGLRHHSPRRATGVARESVAPRRPSTTLVRPTPPFASPHPADSARRRPQDVADEPTVTLTDAMRLARRPRRHCPRIRHGLSRYL